MKSYKLLYTLLTETTSPSLWCCVQADSRQEDRQRGEEEGSERSSSFSLDFSQFLDVRNMISFDFLDLFPMRYYRVYLKTFVNVCVKGKVVVIIQWLVQRTCEVRVKGLSWAAVTECAAILGQPNLMLAQCVFLMFGLEGGTWRKPTQTQREPVNSAQRGSAPARTKPGPSWC